MAARQSVVVIHPGTVTVGGWCDVHALPHQLTCDVWLLGTHGLALVSTIRRCDREA
ncbi:hypothetical protein L332_03535 [Agrococcus pavilionensis RW1]|uniref:Uncharacterized protein n=1 Tax=Agrococcus pavilionensis RW1 TaxID=1330458 RepID=U1MNQ3_9MICO|nr:hypothetical protein [Agrococcus pavilionensis]ERG63526.1 hypothetical protein L332_03535 [Agrococcus pavilionensis RW1]